ncbi:hypothetical protein BD560DRAFT_386837 [Blakeslea trispora]|nr:hypothetical protein BD560DRAFT_386837 [Blakeslea trispora]
MTYTDTSIRFPPATVSSKLSTKMLRKVSEPVDWIQQYHLEIIQDVPYSPSDQHSLSKDSESLHSIESECHTITTTSTDGNRKNNIYQFYRQQQELMRPIDEDLPPTLPIADCIQIQDTSISPHDTMCSIEPHHAKQKKKGLHLIKRLMTKMRDSVEKPFQSIDHRF